MTELFIAEDYPEYSFKQQDFQAPISRQKAELRNIIEHTTDTEFLMQIENPAKTLYTDALIANPHTPEPVLWQVLQTPEGMDMRKQITHHPNASHRVWMAMAEMDPITIPGSELFTVEDLPLDVLVTAVSSLINARENETSRFGVSHPSMTREGLIEIASRARDDVDISVLAFSSHVTPEILLDIVSPERERYLYAAKMFDAPAMTDELMTRILGEMLSRAEKAASDEGYPFNTFLYVLWTTTLSAESADNLVDASLPYQMRISLARNESLTAYAYGKLALDENAEVRRFVAKNPGVSENALGVLLFDANAEVRREALRNELFSVELAIEHEALHKLLDDPDTSVRAFTVAAVNKVDGLAEELGISESSDWDQVCFEFGVSSKFWLPVWSDFYSVSESVVEFFDTELGVSSLVVEDVSLVSSEESVPVWIVKGYCSSSDRVLLQEYVKLL